MGRGLGVKWSGQRHLIAEYRPIPLHLQFIWQLILQAGVGQHVSLLAPIRMVLLQLDQGRGSGRLGGGGAGNLVPAC